MESPNTKWSTWQSYSALTAFLSAELAKIPSKLKNIEGHGHKYSIINDTKYKKLDKVNGKVTKPKHPGVFTVTTTAQTGKYQQELLEYYTHQKAKVGAKECLEKSFEDTGILVDMMDNDDYINGTLFNILNHLWDTIPEHEKQREINEIEKILDVEWNEDEIIQKYMKKLQDARYQLQKLEADPKTPKMIQKVICTMEKCAKLDKVVCYWCKQDASYKKKTMEKLQETFCIRNL